jgi:hypothetical protein
VKGLVEAILMDAWPISKGRVPPLYEGLRRNFKRASSAPDSATTKASLASSNEAVDDRLVLINAEDVVIIVSPTNMMIISEVKA